MGTREQSPVYKYKRKLWSLKVGENWKDHAKDRLNCIEQMNGEYVIRNQRKGVLIMWKHEVQ